MLLSSSMGRSAGVGFIQPTELDETAELDRVLHRQHGHDRFNKARDARRLCLGARQAPTLVVAPGLGDAELLVGIPHRVR